jgi:hypothetical protein
MKKTTQSLLRKLWFIKPESERTKTQKVVRDVALFAVVVYAAVISFLYFDAEAEIVEIDCNNIGQTTTQVALNK